MLRVVAFTNVLVASVRQLGARALADSVIPPGSSVASGPNPACACRPLLALIGPYSASPVNWPVYRNNSDPAGLGEGEEGGEPAVGYNADGVQIRAVPVQTAFTSASIAYLGPDGPVPDSCDPALQDPREVFLGEMVLSLTAGLPAGATGGTQGGYIPGEDVLFYVPSASAGPLLFYDTLWNARTGTLTVLGRTQLARQLLSLDNLRYNNTGGLTGATPGLRTVTLTVFTANGCVSNTLHSTILVSTWSPTPAPTMNAPALPAAPTSETTSSGRTALLSGYLASIIIGAAMLHTR